VKLKTGWIAALAAMVIVTASLTAKSFISDGGNNMARGLGATPQRIISLAPSVTEILFAIGLGDKVVGVTRYCDYPPEALRLPKVGGYYDPSYEAVMALKPDLVIVLKGNEGHREKFESLGFAAMEIDNESVETILDSILAIGRAGGAEAAAKKLADDLKRRMKKIGDMTKGRKRPRVLVSVGRNMGTGTIKDVYIAGQDTFYNGMIKIAGGVNAYDGVRPAYPTVSAEGIMRMKPDFIIDMIPGMDMQSAEGKAVLREWESVAGAKAIREGRVHVFGEKYTVIPGPRFILTLERIARLIHPDIDWDRP